MGIFDDDFFDFNDDGQVDDLDRLITLDTFFITNGEYEEGENVEEEDDSDVDNVLIEELENHDLDMDDLKYMDEDERNQAIEDAGLDPDDYEDLFMYLFVSNKTPVQTSTQSTSSVAKTNVPITEKTVVKEEKPKANQQSMNQSTAKNPSYMAPVLIVLAMAFVALIALSNYWSNKITEENHHKKVAVQKVCEALQWQYFPLSGEATHLEFVNSRRLSIDYLDSYSDYRNGGDIYYDYDIVYVDDQTFNLTAKKDIPGSTYKDNYHINCVLHKDGGYYWLTDLETDDPDVEFDTSEMLPMDQREAVRDKRNSFFERALSEEIQKSNRSSSTNKSTSSNSSSSKSSTTRSKSSTSTDEIDPSDYDIEQYYLDYQDEFEDEDDAWDDFMDNPEYWDDYD